MNLRENISRSKSAVNMMKAIVVLSVVLLMSETFNIYLYHNLNSSDWIYDSLTMITAIIGVVALAFTVVYVLAMVYFIRWFRRAYFNLHTIFKIGLKYSEGWAAGAWFVPIFNLFGPYRIAQEMNDKTAQLLQENKKEVNHSLSRTIGIWWTLWVVSSVFSSISNQMEKSLDFGVLTVGAYITAIATVISIGAGIMCIKYIQDYSAMETELSKIHNQGIPDFVDGNTDILDSTF